MSDTPKTQRWAAFVASGDDENARKRITTFAQRLGAPSTGNINHMAESASRRSPANEAKKPMTSNIASTGETPLPESLDHSMIETLPLSPSDDDTSKSKNTASQAGRKAPNQDRTVTQSQVNIPEPNPTAPSSNSINSLSSAHIDWYGPAQCIKLAAKLNDGDYTGCLFVNRADLVAFVVSIPDQLDDLLTKGVDLCVIVEDDSDVGSTIEFLNANGLHDDLSAVDPNGIMLSLDDLSAGLRSAHSRKRRHQIRAATVLSFFAIASVLVFYAVFWNSVN